MIFDVATVVAFASRTITLEPGDVIATGTPGRAWATIRSPPRYLAGGDVMRCEIDGIGAHREPGRRRGAPASTTMQRPRACAGDVRPAPTPAMTATIGAGTMRALAKTRAGPGRRADRAAGADARARRGPACGSRRPASAARTFTSSPGTSGPPENLVPPRDPGPRARRHASSRPASGVTRVREGDLVGVESHLFDWTCAQCRRGDMHLCRNLRVIGVHVDGGFAEHVVIPEANAIESNGLDPAVVALQEPMGNAVHAAFVEPIEGRSVLVTGCGPIGLCAVGIAQGRGRLAGDRHRHRAVPARAGADDGRRPGARCRRPGDRGADPRRDRRRRRRGRARDERRGSGARPGAGGSSRAADRSACSASSAEPCAVDLSDLVIMKGLRLHGIYGRRIYDTWERTQSLLRSGALDVTPIITHRLDLADWERVRPDRLAPRRQGGPAAMTEATLRS